MTKNRSECMEPRTIPLPGRIAAMALLFIVAGAAPAHAQPQTAPSSAASLNFVGVEIETVIKAIGHYTGTAFIIDPRVKGVMNLVSEKPVSRSQSFQLLTSALRMHGYAVVVGDNGLAKVVPEVDAKLQAGPTVPDSVRGDQLATQIFRLNHESAAGMVNVLRPLISPNNTINANPGNNSLVITDYADNLRRLGKIIATLDMPPGADPDIVPVRHAIAGDIATMVNRLLEPGAPAGDGPRVMLFADARTNSVIIRAPSAARANLARSLVARLDQATAQEGNIHVVSLRNADAAKLAQTLRAVVSFDASMANAGGTPPQAQAQPGKPDGGMQAASLPLTPQSQASPSSGPAGFIQADPATNTLIITASEPIYRNLRAVIDRLDARRAQVYVESLIVEVTAGTAADFGVQWVGAAGDAASRYRAGAVTSFGDGGNNLINLAAGAASGTFDALPGAGLSLGIVRQVNGRATLGALARALETESGVNILSMPNLITLDNEEARIIVGKNVPLVTGQFATSASGGATGVNPFQTIERKDIGLSLHVRPQISEGGTVKMSIYQETSDVLSEGPSGITTSKRAIDTNVLVDDGQIIVLGGLIEDSLQDGKEKVPGLGDIPILGNLFKYQSRKHAKTNLLVFLRPTVVRSNEQSASLTGDRYDFMRNVQIDAQRQAASVLPNVDTPVLPQLENGQPAGGVMVKPVPPAKAAGARHRCRIPLTKRRDES